ncbi:MAG TPA: hypothetical protein VGA56_22480, partial [Opitutaceae bacterium]
TLIDANEYRYDSTGRQRYVVRRLDISTFEPLDFDRWQDYAGESIYGDYLVDPDTADVTEYASYLAGVGRVRNGETDAEYYGGDLIGTHRLVFTILNGHAVKGVYAAAS